MIRLSGATLYRLGAALRPLREIANNATKGDVLSATTRALEEIERLLSPSTQETIRLPATNQPAQTLRIQLDSTRTKLTAEIGKDVDEWSKQIDFYTGYSIRSLAESFEPVLVAELEIADLYVITKKGGYNTTDLAENGKVIFPPDLEKKVPGAIPDAKQAGRCIAFDLPTAAAFHMHRANETVLHRYYGAVASSKTPPTNASMGAWIAALEAEPGCDKKVVSALRDLKDLHRNPVVHPEQSLEDIDEAIALLGAINGAMRHMLKVIK